MVLSFREIIPKLVSRTLFFPLWPRRVLTSSALSARKWHFLAWRESFWEGRAAKKYRQITYAYPRISVDSISEVPVVTIHDGSRWCESRTAACSEKRRKPGASNVKENWTFIHSIYMTYHSEPKFQVRKELSTISTSSFWPAICDLRPVTRDLGDTSDSLLRASTQLPLNLEVTNKKKQIPISQT